jgi:hypothetical protein
VCSLPLQPYEVRRLLLQLPDNSNGHSLPATAAAAAACTNAISAATTINTAGAINAVAPGPTARRSFS